MFAGLVSFVLFLVDFCAEAVQACYFPAAMSRIDEVIAEVDAAREAATRKFAAEVNMPLADFRRHFDVVLELAAGDEPTVSFRVEPREERGKVAWPPVAVQLGDPAGEPVDSSNSQIQTPKAV